MHTLINWIEYNDNKKNVEVNEIDCQNIDIVKKYKWMLLIKFMNWKNCDFVNWKNRVKCVYIFIFRFDQSRKIYLSANCLSFLSFHFFKQDVFFIKIRINVSRRFFIRWLSRRKWCLTNWIEVKGLIDWFKWGRNRRKWKKCWKWSHFEKIEGKKMICLIKWLIKWFVRWLERLRIVKNYVDINVCINIGG